MNSNSENNIKFNKRTLVDDLQFGKSKEIEILPIIINYFNDDIKFVEYKYSIYDYQGVKYKYELKSRTNKYLDFETTLIPESKIKYRKNNFIKFLFYFTDGLYYIKFNETKFKKYKLENFCRNKRDDYNDVPKLYYYIPVKDLIKIDF
jgi:hypothetical protein